MIFLIFSPVRMFSGDDRSKLVSESTARTNLIRHGVKTDQDSCKYVMTYHRVLDGILSLWVTMWIERLSLLVINCREKLAT